MCGIAGIVLAASRGSDWSRERIQKMTATLNHRGPDACGTWCGAGVALGHTRLSIIDLSDAGRQPMRDDTGRYTMVYNGEVYNFESLRRELEARGCRFRSQTDSEVVLYAYREWGYRALERFNGMWAFAIWDAERRELFAARDRAGKKPLYYTMGDDGSLYFASEIKAFLALGMRFGIEPQAAFDFLTQGTYGHLNGKSFFSGVAQLPPAHWMLVRPDQQPHVQRFWSLPIVRRSERIPYDARLQHRFRELFEDAVRLRLKADVAVGATLSGGLDSSTVVGAAERLTGGAPIHLFTSLYPDSHYDETPFFNAVVSRLKEPIVHRAVPSPSNFRDDLLAVLDHQEEPFGDTSILAHYRLMRSAREANVPVILSGQGGDELLLGYPSMVHAYLGHIIGGGHLYQALSAVGDWSAASGLSRRSVLTSSLAHSLPLTIRDHLRTRYVATLASTIAPELRARCDLHRFTRDSGRDSFDDYVGQVFTRFGIPHLVHYDDRNAMAFSVEGRMPFLDYRLVELAFSADYRALFANGTTKRVLRESCADLLPAEVRTRGDKVGFHTPMAEWLRAHQAWIDEEMAEDAITAVGVLRPDTYRDELRRLGQGHDASALPVWRGFILHLWARRFEMQSMGAGFG